MQILKKEEEDARLLDRCEAKRKEWAKHWQCNESVQNLEEKQWKNEELKKSEEALARLKECDLEKHLDCTKQKTGVECDGFHPKVPLDLTQETRKGNCRVPGEGGTEWEMAAASLHDDVLLDH